MREKRVSSVKRFVRLDARTGTAASSPHAKKAIRSRRMAFDLRCVFLQARRESNPQPPVLETGALPIELLPFGAVRANAG